MVRSSLNKVTWQEVHARRRILGRVFINTTARTARNRPGSSPRSQGREKYVLYKLVKTYNSSLYILLYSYMLYIINYTKYDYSDTSYHPNLVPNTLDHTRIKDQLLTTANTQRYKLSA